MTSRSERPTAGRRRPGALAWSAALTLLALPALASPTLRGGGGSLDRQNAQARAHDFTYLTDRRDVERFVDLGYLVPVPGNRDYLLHQVSFPYARKEVLLFLEDLGRQHRAACGEQLVVTSLTRPRSLQPPNASRRSVHPTGMAIDLRRSWRFACRAWLEAMLLHLEREGVLEATREIRPPHYHVAVFPRPYRSYREMLAARGEPQRHLVVRGDTLFKIASSYDTTVGEVQRANGLRSSQIYPGQLLVVPTSE